MLNLELMQNWNKASEGEYFDLFSLLDLYIPFPVRFWVYLSLNCCSILASIFVLYHILFDRTLRQALNNHIIIVLLIAGLIYESTSVPLMLHYYRVRNTWQLSSMLAEIWSFLDYASYETGLIGFAWATIERHILIFHQAWVATKKKRFFLHYLPIILIAIYPSVYFSIGIFFAPCVNLNVLQPLNGVPPPCISLHPIFGQWHTFAHDIIPTLIVTIASSGLLIRVLWQKSRMNRAVQWRQQGKMTIQLLSIAALYLFFNFPRSVVQIYIAAMSTSYLIIKLFAHLIFFSIQLVFFFPFVCCASMPELRTRVMKLFVICGHRRGAVGPVPLKTNTLERKNPNQGVATVETR